MPNQLLAGAAAGLALAPAVYWFTRWALAPYRKRRGQLRQGAAASAGWVEKLAARDRANRVVLAGNVLTLTDETGHRKSYDLARLKNVSVVARTTTASVRRSVELRGDRTLILPALAQGLPELLAWLCARPNFDQPAWDRVLAATATTRATVLRVPLNVNARWLAETPAGFTLTLLRPTGELPVSWDILYSGLRALPGVELRPDPYGNPQLRLGPARIGALALDDLWVRGTPPRDDVPVKEWNSYTVLEPEGRARNYGQLHDYFAPLAGPEQNGSYNRADAVQWLGGRDGINVRLIYWHDSDYAPESGYCSLQLANARPYPEYLTDPYCEALRPEDIDFTLFPLEAIFVERDFRTSRTVRATPPALRPLFQSGQAEYLIWRDRRPGRIGFASPEFAIILEFAQADRLELTNLTPARGGGYSVLQLVDKTGAKVKVGTAEYRTFNPCLEQLKQATGLPVELLPEYPDD